MRSAHFRAVDSPCYASVIHWATRSYPQLDAHCNRTVNATLSPVALLVQTSDASTITGLIQWHLPPACRLLSASLPRPLLSAGSHCRAPSATHPPLSTPPSHRCPRTPLPTNSPSPATSTSSTSPSLSRGPQTPGSAGSHARKPSQFGALERFKLNCLEGSTIGDGSVSEWLNAVPITPVHFNTPPSSVASID